MEIIKTILNNLLFTAIGFGIGWIARDVVGFIIPHKIKK
jgi:hypothetical protein